MIHGKIGTFSFFFFKFNGKGLLGTFCNNGGGAIFFFFFQCLNQRLKENLASHSTDRDPALGVSLETQGTGGAVTRERVLLPAPLKIRCKTSGGGIVSHLILQRYGYKAGFGAARLYPTNSSGSNS